MAWTEEDKAKMEAAAEKAQKELAPIQEKYPEAMKEIEDWLNRWYHDAGWKRLAKQLASGEMVV